MQKAFIVPVILGLLLPVAVRAQAVHDREVAEVQLLQDARTVTRPLPKGFDGRPDWVRSLKYRQIDPRETLWGAPRAPEAWGEAPKEGIVFANTRYMPYVVFPHQPHTEWLSCGNCHDALFPRKKTGALRGMTSIFRGESCGACHGRVAFSPEGSCYRCHSMPNPTAILQQSPFVAPVQVEAAPINVEPPIRSRRGKSQGLPSGLRPAPSVVKSP